ncbi:MAG: hypothetical protein R3C56_37910 [Pirellulaceae bacterium]
MLKAPVIVPYRPLKDPREIRMLDPACGSMHFGLYAFDLYLKIYEEFWDLAAGDTDIELAPTQYAPLRTIYTQQAAYMRAAEADHRAQYSRHRHRSTSRADCGLVVVAARSVLGRRRHRGNRPSANRAIECRLC